MDLFKSWNLGFWTERPPTHLPYSHIHVISWQTKSPWALMLSWEENVQW